MARLGSDFQGSVQASAGGFAWWYADLVDAEGRGLVAIWSLGLPFLPGARLGGKAAARPAVHFAYYTRGRPCFYLLQEHQAETVRGPSPDGTAQIGSSRFDVTSQGRVTELRIVLDEEIPNSSERLHAVIELSGQSPLLPEPSNEASHLWTPRLLHAHARAEFSVRGRLQAMSGVGYFDGNASVLPLHDQGIESWRWARFALGRRAFVVYDVSGAAGTMRVLEAGDDGSFRELPVAPRFLQYRRGLYGVSSPRRIELEFGQERIVCLATRLVDDGPFYQRFMLDVFLERRDASPSSLLEPAGNSRGGATGTRGVGFYEVVFPGRIDQAWQRPFVRMRTHRVGEPNSPWLPLFTGWQAGRVSRLLAGVVERFGRRVRSEPDHRGSEP